MAGRPCTGQLHAPALARKAHACELMRMQLGNVNASWNQEAFRGGVSAPTSATLFSLLLRAMPENSDGFLQILYINYGTPQQ